MVVRPQPARRDDAVVSVVIPCYNYGRYLGAAIGSALDQSGVHPKVIVVDDCSSDDSLAVAREIAAGDERVDVVARATNGGPVATFNDGLTRVTGEYLVRLDADDLLTPGSLARSVALLDAHPEVGLVYGHPLHFVGQPPPQVNSRVHRWRIWPGRRWLAARCASGTNVITSPEVVMRRSVVDVVGGQRPELAHAHDMEMWLRMATASDVAHLDGPDQAWHRDHDASLSTRLADPVAGLLERLLAFEVLFGGSATQRADGAPLLATARHALALEAVRGASHMIDRGEPEVTLAPRLAEAALTCDPDIVSTKDWAGYLRRVDTDGSRRLDRRLRAQWSANTYRLRRRLEAHRWRRTGVYERV